MFLDFIYSGNYLKVIFPGIIFIFDCCWVCFCWFVFDEFLLSIGDGVFSILLLGLILLFGSLVLGF